MSDLGVLTWIAIGAATGWAVSRLMVGADDTLRATAAGMLGAVLGGLGMRLLDSPPALGSSNLNASVAALAGAVWLTWITCVVTSRRQRGAAPPPPEVCFTRVESTAPIAVGDAVPTYVAARDALVEQLLRDAMAHDAKRYDEIGRRFDAVERRLPRGSAPELQRLRVAMTFWDGWIDARNRRWYSDSHITKPEWPFLARTVAADLEGDRDATNTRVVACFDVAISPPPGRRAQTLAARLRAG